MRALEFVLDQILIQMAFWLIWSPLFFDCDQTAADPHHGLQDRFLLGYGQCVPDLAGIGRCLRWTVFLPSPPSTSTCS